MRWPWNLAEAWQFVRAQLASPGLAILVLPARHAAVAGEVMAVMTHLAGNLRHDTHSAVLMREHGIRRICIGR